MRLDPLAQQRQRMAVAEERLASGQRDVDRVAGAACSRRPASRAIDRGFDSALQLVGGLAERARAPRAAPTPRRAAGPRRCPPLRAR